MKLKAVRSFLLLSLALILVIGGTTMAWFTAEYNLPSAAEMVVGTLEFEITDASAEPCEGAVPEEEAGESVDWLAGDSKDFRWTFENTGSKTAFFRACPLVELKDPEGLPEDGKSNSGTEALEDNPIAWSLPEGSAWKAGRDAHGDLDGWFYYCQPVKSGEEIDLVLEGCLPENAPDASCTVLLQAEAVQASREAASAEWPGWPGS